MNRAVWLTISCLLMGLYCFTGEAADGRRVPFDLGHARMEDDRVKIVFTAFKPVAVQKEEAYTVTVKVPVKKLDPVTNQEETTYEDQTEMRTRTVTVSHEVFELRAIVLLAAALKYLELDGTVADQSSLAERLKQQTLVVVTHNGKPLPSEYGMLFQAGTLVIAMPPNVNNASPPEPPRPLPPQVTPPTAPLPASPQSRAEAVPSFFVSQLAAPEATQHEDFELPDGRPPTFAMASINAQDYFVLSTSANEDREVPAYMTLSKKVTDADGTAKDVFETKQLIVTQQIRSSVTTLFPPKSVTGQTVDGTPMEDRHLAALKLRQIPVIVSRDGKPVDPLWLGNLKPKMLIVVPPSLNSPFMGHGPAAGPTPVAPSPPGAPQA